MDRLRVNCKKAFCIHGGQATKKKKNQHKHLIKFKTISYNAVIEIMTATRVVYVLSTHGQSRQLVLILLNFLLKGTFS